VKRRDFIAGLGSTAAWPIAAWAQQAAMPVIGILSLLPPSTFSPGLDAIHKELGETGFVEGRNVAIEYRWAENQLDRLPALAMDLTRRRVAAIVAIQGDEPALAAQAATATIPIVFAAPQNPTRIGLVASFNRPGANVTGVAGYGDELTAKRLELLHELVPSATVIAMLSNPAERAAAEISERNANAAATALRLRLDVVNASRESDLESAFESMVRLRAEALLVTASGSFVPWQNQIVALAARHMIPACFHRREFVEIGGLFSYGADLADAYRLAGVYVGRILKGEKPADLPVIQPTKIEMAINLKTARTLGLAVPQTLLVAADQVIE
jgi:putative tryptophan/tyrosine transport system substrate-binding protein